MSSEDRAAWRVDGDPEDKIRILEFTCAYDTNLVASIKAKECKWEYITLASRWRGVVPDTTVVCLGIGALGTCPQSTVHKMETLLKLGAGMAEDSKIDNSLQKALKKACIRACEESKNIWDLWASGANT